MDSMELGILRVFGGVLRPVKDDAGARAVRLCRRRRRSSTWCGNGREHWVTVRERVSLMRAQRRRSARGCCDNEEGNRVGCVQPRSARKTSVRSLVRWRPSDGYRLGRSVRRGSYARPFFHHDLAARQRRRCAHACRTPARRDSVRSQVEHGRRSARAQGKLRQGSGAHVLLGGWWSGKPYSGPRWHCPKCGANMDSYIEDM
jgi:hypothetical protein